MLLDAFEALARTPQDVTDTDAYTTNAKDLGSVTPNREIGAGEPLSIIFAVTTAAAGSTDTTDFLAVQSANANLSSHTELAVKRIANALLTAGALVVLPIPAGSVTARYIGGRVELGSGDTISIESYIIPSSFVQSFKAYASGFLVS
jgi:hypothetical protein